MYKIDNNRENTRKVSGETYIMILQVFIHTVQYYNICHIFLLDIWSESVGGNFPQNRRCFVSKEVSLLQKQVLA
jgi:hypothetical protein